MKTFFVTSLLLVSTFLAGCAAVPVGGEGMTKKGDKLIAEAMLGYDGNNVVKIISADGWECSGTYNKYEMQNTVTRKFPLNCSNGAKGNAVMSINQVQQRATIAFKLNNGTSGDVAFGIVN